MTAARIVFVIGSPRSGTTWLQTLLGAHPSVVTPQETDVFATTIAPLQAAWDRQAVDGGGEPRAGRTKGLPTILRAEEFHTIVAGVVARVVDAMAALDPDATVIVEKSPAHSRHTDLIATYLPEATFIHIVRDGRDVVSSLRAAARGWGSNWAPAELNRGARLWRETVRGARRAASTGRYVEVRYEALRAGDPEPLRRAFEACGLTMTDDECRALLAEYSLARMAGNEVESTIALGGAAGQRSDAVREPSGFYGDGRVGGWATEWSQDDRLLFDIVAGDLLVELGDEPDHSWAGTAAQRRRFLAGVRVRRIVAKAGRRIGHRANLMLRRLPDAPGTRP